MAILHSAQMHLSSAERSWLPWFGRTGKFAMGRACRMNRDIYPQIEQTFEGIAQTRVRILQNWTQGQWEHLAELAESLGGDFAHVDSQVLRSKREQAPDFSELCVIDALGQVLASTWAEHGQ